MMRNVLSKPILMAFKFNITLIFAYKVEGTFAKVMQKLTNLHFVFT